jgi:hypothetical protein
MEQESSKAIALDYRAIMREKEVVFRQKHAADSVLTAGAAAVNFSCGYLYWLQRTINTETQRPDPDWSKVASLFLLNRAIEDIRSALQLAERGAPVQAMSLLSSVYEVEAALLEIGRDAAKGKKWLTEPGTAAEVFKAPNENGKIVKQKLKDRGKDFYVRAGIAGVSEQEIREAHERRYETVYKSLCSYKHVQPDIQKQFGLRKTEKGLEVLPEPQLTPYVRQTTLASSVPDNLR